MIASTVKRGSSSGILIRWAHCRAVQFWNENAWMCLTCAALAYQVT